VVQLEMKGEVTPRVNTRDPHTAKRGRWFGVKSLHRMTIYFKVSSH